MVLLLILLLVQVAIFISPLYHRMGDGGGVETFHRNVSTRWWALSQTLGVLYKGGEQGVGGFTEWVWLRGDGFSEGGFWSQRGAVACPFDEANLFFDQ
jgi:hypothetical protein